MENGENSEDENSEPAPKKIKSEWSKSYSNKVMQMMKKMGYENDKGLGKLNQGRLEPVVAVQQDGRRGLGLKLDTVQNSAKQWDPTSEEIYLPEIVEWISNNDCSEILFEKLNTWMRIDNKKDTLNDETLFCQMEILERVLESKTVFDELNDNDIRRARSRCNPFETIRSSMFLNRAAVKMANIDSMCDFMFTNPKDQLGNSLLQDNELLYFADICAGPGGFSEYVLYRKSWKAKGFGFTLRGSNDFKLDKFSAGSPESFDPYYGVKNDGDIYDKENQDSLTEYIYKHCNGVHFVMADGGFSVEGRENIQEILSKQLYLCQCLTALKILRENGSFVCKLFDIFTKFSVGLIYLMYKCFNQIAIIKPNSSRPANSERYLVCKWKKHNTDAICSYLDLINDILNKGDPDRDVLDLVSYEVMMQDDEFINYITKSNNTIGRNQIIGLRKIAAFCQYPNLKETKQSEYRKRCLELWNLPDILRQAPEIKSTEKLLEEILGADWYENKTFLDTVPIELVSTENLQKNVESIYDWYFVPIGRSETNLNTCSIFLCKSRGNLLRYTEMKKWESVGNNFEISPKSLFYGEIVFEYNGEGRTQTKVYGLHIIDAIMLGGIDIRRYKLSERMKMCEQYSISLNKPFKEGATVSIRSKQVYKLNEVSQFFNQMRHYILKDNLTRLGFSFKSDMKFFVPGGILVFCEICHNFFSKMSKSSNMLYYFDKTRKESYYKTCMPNEVQKILNASFRNSFMRRLIWKWSKPAQVEETNSIKTEENLLYRIDLQNFILSKQNS